MEIEGVFPFRGEVVWLTPEQGGRKSGVPPVPPGVSYAHVAHVPPHTVDTGSASFVLRGWDAGEWRSPAEGRWLLVENAGDQLVIPGTLIIVTEGATPVALFRVDEVVGSDEPVELVDQPWFQRALVSPAVELLAAAGVGESVDPSLASPLGVGVEGLFRSEVPFQYSGWPADSTTDGSTVDLCVCVAVDRLDVYGRTCIDFGPEAFPFRALIAVAEDGSTALELFIGDVDPETGAPPRLRSPVLVSVDDDQGAFDHVELIEGRHQTTVEWTSVLVASSKRSQAGSAGVVTAVVDPGVDLGGVEAQ